jgi:hypothetical protein
MRLTLISQRLLYAKTDCILSIDRRPGGAKFAGNADKNLCRIFRLFLARPLSIIAS